MKTITIKDIIKNKDKYTTYGPLGPYLCIYYSKELFAALQNEGYIWQSGKSLLNKDRNPKKIIFLNVNKTIVHDNVAYNYPVYTFIAECLYCGKQMKSIKAINETIIYCPICQK